MRKGSKIGQREEQKIQPTPQGALKLEWPFGVVTLGAKRRSGPLCYCINPLIALGLAPRWEVVLDKIVFFTRGQFLEKADS